MTKDQYIVELKAELRLHMDWARDLPDEYLDGDPDVRKAFVEEKKRRFNRVQSAWQRPT